MAQGVPSPNGSPKMWDVFTRVLMPIILVSLGMLGKCSADLTAQVHAIDVRLSRAEANRFTSSDGARMLKRVEVIKDELSRQFTALRQTIPAQIPPEWFRIQVDVLTRKVDNIGERIIGLEGIVKELKGK